ncbi:12828_t:CDS:2 [Dentiscutata erythropus]|uniref:Chromatin modification-related protein EAF3 n=1 Tax=Dentiscutata erythropus TaxID=1348616 RepID=A0A9N9AKW4_9GLOM|nr:12828_t:CDS:2 [Dentiscutata erythropus]
MSRSLRLDAYLISKKIDVTRDFKINNNIIEEGFSSRRWTFFFYRTSITLTSHFTTSSQNKNQNTIFSSSFNTSRTTDNYLCQKTAIYEAKVLFHLQDDVLLDTFWDEWVPQCRVLKYNEENLNKQQQIMNSLEKKNKPADSAVRKKAGVVEKGKKRKRELSVKKTDDNVKKLKIIIDLPETLRAYMVHDCNNIKSQMFVPLPRKPTVSDIISDYRAWRCLGTRLLYQLERHQYKEMRDKFKHLDNSQIYGAEHLLRLFGNGLSKIGIKYKRCNS